MATASSENIKLHENDPLNPPLFVLLENTTERDNSSSANFTDFTVGAEVSSAAAQENKNKQRYQILYSTTNHVCFGKQAPLFRKSLS